MVLRAVTAVFHFLAHMNLLYGDSHRRNKGRVWFLEEVARVSQLGSGHRTLKAPQAWKSMRELIWQDDENLFGGSLIPQQACYKTLNSDFLSLWHPCVPTFHVNCIFILRANRRFFFSSLKVTDSRNVSEENVKNATDGLRQSFKKQKRKTNWLPKLD